LTGLDKYVLQITTKFVSCHTADSKAVKQEANGTVILPPLVFPASMCFQKQLSLTSWLIFNTAAVNYDRKLVYEIGDRWPEKSPPPGPYQPGVNLIKLFSSLMVK
jgi:hypothetical protein